MVNRSMNWIHVVIIVFLEIARISDVFSDIVCLSCSGVPFPKDCYRTVRCSDLEQCFTEEAVTPSGTIIYNLGCQSKSNCDKLSGRRSVYPDASTVSAYLNATKLDVDLYYDLTLIHETQYDVRAVSGDIVTCAECCRSGDHCNRLQCGQTSGALANQMYCATCDDVLHPDECEYIALCNENDVCYTEFINLNGEDRYRLGCVPDRHCGPFGSALPLVGRQAADTGILDSLNYCHECCTSTAGGGCNTLLCGKDGVIPPGVSTSELLQPPLRIDFCRDAFIAACSLIDVARCSDAKYKHYACREKCKTCVNPAHGIATTAAPGSTTRLATDCFYDSRQYQGSYDVTISGKTCVTWYDIDPFMQGMPDGNVSLAGNKCRDPGGIRGHPWCYTVLSATEIEFCNVPYCQDCYFAGNTGQYKGYKQTDKNGNMCVLWTEGLNNQSVNLDSRFPDQSTTAAGRYCRDPLGSGKLGCYLQGSVVDCEVPECTTPCSDDPYTDCDGIKDYICREEYLSVTFCAKTCNACSFGLLPGMLIPPPQVCMDNVEARCDAIVPSVCSNKEDALRLCPKSCNLCNLIYNVTITSTTPQTSTTLTTESTTTLPTTTTTMAITTPHWIPTGNWQCRYVGETCYKTRLRECSTVGACSGSATEITTDCNSIDCPDFTTSPPPTPSTTPDPCQDKPDTRCEEAKDVICNEPEVALGVCVKTCNLCGLLTTAPDVCTDYFNCSSENAQAYFCAQEDYAIQFCRKTCRKCDKPPQAIVRNECGDPAGTVERCKIIHDQMCLCNDPVLEPLCTNYCHGNCASYPLSSINFNCKPP